MPKAESKKVTQPELPLQVPEETGEVLDSQDVEIMQDVTKHEEKALKGYRKNLPKRVQVLNEVHPDLVEYADVSPFEVLLRIEQSVNLVRKLHELGKDVVVAYLRSWPTPDFFVRPRPGPDGMVLWYIPVEYTEAMLHALFPGAWSFEPQGYEIIRNEQGRAIEAVAHMVLTICWSDGTIQKVAATGRHPIQYVKKTGEPLSIGNDYKSAESDALKKATERAVGIGWDVYTGRHKRQKEGPAGTVVQTGQPPQNQSKIEAQLRKSYRLPEGLTRKELFEKFWGKCAKLYEKDKARWEKQDKDANAEFDADVHTKATIWLEHQGMWQGKGLVSLKELNHEQLQEALIGIAISKLMPKRFPREKANGSQLGG